MLGPKSLWTALLVALTLCISQKAAAQKSVPVTTTKDFAQALQDQTITEIILDPSGTGVSDPVLHLSAGSSGAARRYVLLLEEELTSSMSRLPEWTGFCSYAYNASWLFLHEKCCL